MTRDEYIEMLAREMAGLPNDPICLLECRAMAGAAIRAIATIAERGGPKLVERDATKEMEEAAMDRDAANERSIYEGVWRAMFDRAPGVQSE